MIIISKLLNVISRAVRRVKFETILKYHEWYFCQISRTNHAIICLYYYPQKLFHMRDYKIAMATFCTSQCQDGGKVFFKKCMNEDVRALKDTLENLNTQIAHQEGFYQEIC